MAIRTKAPEATAPVAASAALPGAAQVESAYHDREKEYQKAVAPKVDYKAEEKARIAGQVRMHCVVAALQSPAGPAFAPTEEAYLTLVTKLADLAFEYTFKGEK